MSVTPAFPEDELKMLRSELLEAGLDSFQAGHLLSAFLTARGYGVSSDDARSVAARLEGSYPLPALRAELAGLAMVM